MAFASAVANQGKGVKNKALYTLKTACTLFIQVDCADFTYFSVIGSKGSRSVKTLLPHLSEAHWSVPEEIKWDRVQHLRLPSYSFPNTTTPGAQRRHSQDNDFEVHWSSRGPTCLFAGELEIQCFRTAHSPSLKAKHWF